EPHQRQRLAPQAAASAARLAQAQNPLVLDQMHALLAYASGGDCAVRIRWGPDGWQDIMLREDSALHGVWQARRRATTPVMGRHQYRLGADAHEPDGAGAPSRLMEPESFLRVLPLPRQSSDPPAVKHRRGTRSRSCCGAAVNSLHENAEDKNRH